MRFSKLWMAVFISVGASCACAQVSVGAGAEFTTGKYGGTESTQELYLPFTGKLQTGLWSFKVTVPYLVVSGPANVIGGGDDRIPIDSSGNGSGGSSGVSDAGSATRTTSGLGDIVARASYSLLQETSSAVGLDVGARVKFGTADEAEGLGTGETDLSLQADLYKPLGAAMLFATLGYRWYGDPPGIELRDVPYFAVGASYRLGGDTAVGLAYDYRPHIVDGGLSISEVSLYWSRRFAREWKLQLYAIVGLSDGSPDVGVGSFLEYQL